jgi:hypothetical protein
MLIAVLSITALVGATGESAGAVGVEQGAVARPALSGERALLDQYCVTCHNRRTKTAGLALDDVDVDHVTAETESPRRMQGRNPRPCE